MIDRVNCATSLTLLSGAVMSEVAWQDGKELITILWVSSGLWIM